MYLRILIGLFAIVASSMACADNMKLLEEGQTAFNAKQYTRAYQLWHALALEGHVDAQVFVGLAHKNGWGVSKDQKQANMWMQIAAEGGNPSAQYFLGLHYVTSDEPKTVDIGVDWLVQAAENGDGGAKHFLIKARINKWLDVPNTLNMKTVVTNFVSTNNDKKIVTSSITKVTPGNIDEVFAGNSQKSVKQMAEDLQPADCEPLI